MEILVILYSMLLMFFAALSSGSWLEMHVYEVLNTTMYFFFNNTFAHLCRDTHNSNLLTQDV